MKNRTPQASSPLDNLRIASPCKASWEAMAGDSRKRFCGDCRKDVFNLSAMSREEAEALLTISNGGHAPCVRYFQRNDGTVMTADCPVGVRRMEKARQRTAAVFAALLTFTFNLFGVARAESTDVPNQSEMLGGAPMPPPMMGDPVVAPATKTPKAVVKQPVMGRMAPKMGKPKSTPPKSK